MATPQLLKSVARSCAFARARFVDGRFEGCKNAMHLKNESGCQTPASSGDGSLLLAGAALFRQEVEAAALALEAEILPLLTDIDRISGQDSWHCILPDELFMGGDSY